MISEDNTNLREWITCSFHRVVLTFSCLTIGLVFSIIPTKWRDKISTVNTVDGRLDDVHVVDYQQKCPSVHILLWDVSMSQGVLCVDLVKDYSDLSFSEWISCDIVGSSEK